MRAPPTPCPNPDKVVSPEIINFKPRVLQNPMAKFQLMHVCPFIDSSKPVCCLEDNVAILYNNFQKIDSVFGGDVPICAVNLKHLWCEFSCNPNKARFVNGTSYTKQPGTGRRLTNVHFSVDDNMACKLYKSCQKV